MPPVTAITVSRADAMAFRYGRHQLGAAPGSVDAAAAIELLDLGVQDTGPDGAAWALEIRGAADRGRSDDLAYEWTLRGAPHAYRRADLADLAVAVAPYSSTDASKRIFDAAAPLRRAGVDSLDALGEMSAEMRRIVKKPTTKGDVSSALTAVLDDHFLRWCNPCQATHAYEQPFRFSALQAGLELVPGTSPPVMRRAKGVRANGFRLLAGEADPRLDVIRGYLRFFGPATQKEVAAYVDAPVKVVAEHWPADAVPVVVTGAPGERFVLADDAGPMAAPPPAPGNAVRLLGPFDPYLQLRDRETLVGDETRRKDLWRTLGRPGAVLAGAEIVATWRPRTRSGRLTVLVEPWRRLSRAVTDAIEVEASRLSAFRDVEPAGVEVGS